MPEHNVPSGDNYEKRGAAEWIAAGSSAVSAAAAVYTAVQSGRPKDPPPSNDGKK